MISSDFVEDNYEVLESLLREQRRQIRNEDLRTELEDFSEDYDEEREMEPRPRPTRETTPPLWPRSPGVRRQRERVVGFEEAPNRERSRAGRNAEGSRPLEIEARENGNNGMNLPPLLAAHLGRNESGQPMQSSLTSVYGGHQPSTNIRGNLPPNGVINGQPLSSLSRLIMIEAREVETNGAPNDQRENFKRSKKSLWDNKRGQKSRDRFSPYRGPNHGLLSSMSKSPREILATEKVDRSFEHPRRIKKESAKSSENRVEGKKDKGATPNESPILMIRQKESYTRDNVSEYFIFGGREITFPSVTRGRTTMQKMGIVVSTIHGAIKFHTAKGIGTVFSTYESDKIKEVIKNARETPPASTKGVLSCTKVEEKVFINDRYPEQTVTIGKQLPEHFKERLKTVGIKRLHDDLEVTAAKVCVTAAKLKLVLLVKIEENILSSYYCLYKVNAAGV
ncbi:hypothetical protein Tco_0968744 [Tanacetum coccineum]